MQGETPKNVNLNTYDALCKDKFKEIDEDIRGMRKLLWGLLASIVLVLLTFTFNTVVTYANRHERLDEIRAIVEEVVNGK